jgi:hypothetical protein
MVQEVIPNVRALFDEGGFLGKDDNRDYGGLFLMGVYGRLFRVDYDFQVSERLGEYVAIGSGESQAEGSLFTSGLICDADAGVMIGPVDRINMALHAAQAHTAYVREPWVIMAMTKDGGEVEVEDDEDGDGGAGDETKGEGE